MRERSKKTGRLLKLLVELTHRLDPTRPAAIGGAQRGGFDTIGDIAGYNGDGAAIFQDPGYPNFVHATPSIIRDVIHQVRPQKLVLAHMGGFQRWSEVEELLLVKTYGSIRQPAFPRSRMNNFADRTETWCGEDPLCNGFSVGVPDGLCPLFPFS